jgi:hypothetical protein
MTMPGINDPDANLKNLSVCSGFFLFLFPINVLQRMFFENSFSCVPMTDGRRVTKFSLQSPVEEEKFDAPLPGELVVFFGQSRSGSHLKNLF